MASTLLIAILLLIALIQVLPQVDLPDTAFHEDTAPVVIKSRRVGALATVQVSMISNLIFQAAPSPEFAETLAPMFPAPVIPAPVLNCSLRC